jgi:hypothetical protein
MMDLDSAIQHCKEQVQEQAKKGCYSCAEEHQQLAEWLKELKEYRDARAEINQALYDDARGEQNDYERGRKSGIFLCESIISVKLGESRSEIPNTCGDAISRQAVLDGLASIAKAKAKSDAQKSLMGRVMFFTEQLPTVTPQQRTGRWIEVIDESDSLGNKTWHHECSICGSDKSGWGTYKHCPDCGTKMEVEE